MIFVCRFLFFLFNILFLVVVIVIEGVFFFMVLVGMGSRDGRSGSFKFFFNYEKRINLYFCSIYRFSLDVKNFWFIIDYMKYSSFFICLKDYLVEIFKGFYYFFCSVIEV